MLAHATKTIILQMRPVCAYSICYQIASQQREKAMVKSLPMMSRGNGSVYKVALAELAIRQIHDF